MEYETLFDEIDIMHRELEVMGKRLYLMEKRLMLLAALDKKDKKGYDGGNE